MPLKPILAAALGSILLATTGQALAGRDGDRGYRSDQGWQQSKHYSSHRYGASSHRDGTRTWRSAQNRSWRKDRGSSVRMYHNYRHGSDLKGIIGGALIGSAITHSLYDTHDRRRWNDRVGEVIGCYRIESLGDGLERRVELPLSWCR